MQAMSTSSKSFCLNLPFLVAAACAAPTQSAPPARGSGQSFGQAMELVCNVDSRAGVQQTDDPLEAAQKRSDYLADHVKNPQVIYERTLWRVQPAKKRAQLIRKQAQKAKFEPCKYADTVEQEGDL